VLRDIRIASERGAREAADVVGFEFDNISSRLAGRLPARASRFLALAAMACAMAVSGCAQHPAQREVTADPIPAAAPVHERPEFRIRRPSRALLVSQPAPDCEFRGPNRNTVDEVEWARLKLDYERQCYQRAEKVARDRLRLLQASRCEVEPVRHPLTTIR
jgi:hypothetical protein